MKNMQPKQSYNLRTLFPWILLLILSIGVISCETDDPFEDPAANREPYLGVWQVSESGGMLGNQSYSVEITAGNQLDEIIIEGLYNESQSRVVALITGLSLSIPSQSSAGITYEGSGQANANFLQIRINYTADDGAGPDNVEAILSP